MPWLHGDGSMLDLRVMRDRAVEAWIRTVAAGQQPRRNVLAEYHVTSDGASQFPELWRRARRAAASSRGGRVVALTLLREPKVTVASFRRYITKMRGAPEAGGASLAHFCREHLARKT